MSRLLLSFLGQFHVTLDGQIVRRFESDNARALLAFLAMEANQAHRRSSLAALLWPDHSEAAARNNLRQTLFNLRKTLADDRQPVPFLLISHQTVQFNRAAPYHLDVETLQTVLDSLERGTTPLDTRASEHLAGYTAPLLADAALVTSMAFDEWLLLRREQLHRRMMAALTRLSETALAQQRWHEVEQLTIRQLALDPWREEAYRQLMRTLAAQGRRTEALAQFEQCRLVLAEALGLEPMAETVALAEQIKAGTLAAATPPPSLATSSTPHHNLPAALTPFIGRQQVLDDAAARLSDPACRLLTLTGLGGIGKTRVALQLARQLQTAYPDGVWWVSLTGLPATRQTDQLDATLLKALPLTPTDGVPPGQQVRHFLRGRHLLLILDNFEHLTPIAAHIAELLAAAPGSKCLLTSRQPSGVPGEWLYTIPPLTHPTPGTPLAQAEQSEAARLFFQQARMTRPDFPLSLVDEPAVAQICHLVGGHPLALELAASWVDVLSCAEIGQEIRAGLDFLRDETGQRPRRQASVEQILAQTWAKLSQDEAAILDRLAVFRGGFSRQAAQTVAHITPAHLKSLSHKALLFRTSEHRYDLHELVRQYALHHAGDAAADVSQHHAAYFAAFLGQWQPDVMTARFNAALPLIEQEMDNIAAAWQWAVEACDLSFLAQATAPLVAFMRQRGRLEEAVRWLKAAMAVCPTDAPVYPQLINRLNQLRTGMGLQPEEQLALADAAYQTALAHHDITEAVYATLHAGVALYNLGQYAAAWSRLEEGEKLAQQGAAAWVRAIVFSRLCVHAPHSDQLAEGERYGLLGLQISRESGDSLNIWQAEYGLAVLQWHLGKMDEAQRHAAASLAAITPPDFPRQRAISQQMQGYVLYRQKRWNEALTFFKAAEEAARIGGDMDLLVSMLSVMGHIATKQGQWPHAVRHAQEAVALVRQIKNRLQLGVTLFPLGLAFHQLGAKEDAAAAFTEGIHIMDELRDPYLLFAGLTILLEWVVAIGQLPTAGLISAYLYHAMTLPPDQKAELDILCQTFSLIPDPVSSNWEALCAILLSLCGESYRLSERGF